MLEGAIPEFRIPQINTETVYKDMNCIAPAMSQQSTTDPQNEKCISGSYAGWIALIIVVGTLGGGLAMYTKGKFV